MRSWLGDCFLACVEGECIGNGGNTLITDVVFHLVVDVGMGVLGRRLWRRWSRNRCRTGRGSVSRRRI